MKLKELAKQMEHTKFVGFANSNRIFRLRIVKEDSIVDVDTCIEKVLEDETLSNLDILRLDKIDFSSSYRAFVTVIVK